MAEDDKRARARRGKGEGSIYQDANGLWTAVVELPAEVVGGKRVRRRKVIRSKDKRTVLRKLADLKRELDRTGDLPTSVPTVEAWFTRWLERDVELNLRPKTVASYRSVVARHIIPALGPTTRLDKLTPDRIRAVTTHVTNAGLASTYARNAFHVTAKCLDAAVREGKTTRNPARLIDPPRKRSTDLDVLTLDEAVTLLEHIATRPDGARWATALLTGARRGEVIGIEVDRVGDTLDLSWQLQRLKRTETGPVVPADFEYRHLTGGLYLTRPKSAAGWRVVPLVEPLRSILHRHVDQSPSNEWGLLFTDHNHRPRDPDKDSAEWVALMREVFGPDRAVRLHDLRHTAVDLLYLAGVPEDLIQEIVGHSTRQMSRAYKSRGNQVRLRAAMEQVSALLMQGTPELTA